MSDPALTPEVLEELRKASDAYESAKVSYALGSAAADFCHRARRFSDLLVHHAPALLAAAQRVQELEGMYGDMKKIADEGSEARFENHRLRARVAELEESDRLHRAELAAIDDALGPLTEVTRQAQVRGLVERVAELEGEIAAYKARRTEMRKRALAMGDIAKQERLDAARQAEKASP